MDFKVWQTLILHFIFSGSQQVRYSHTDINFPDYSSYKRAGSKDVNVSQGQSEPQRKLFSYLMVGSK